MRGIVVPAFGGPEVLTVEDLPDPAAGPGELLVQVHAAGLNFADVMSRLGHYAGAVTVPYVGGFEFSGVVTGAGTGTSRFRPGDRVAGMIRGGGFAETVCVDERDVIRIPDRLDFVEGAAVPVAYSTAWAGLFRSANLQPGERVLVLAAAGGVGLAAVQLASQHGAEVWGAASPGKHPAVAKAGAAHLVDYTEPGWRDQLPSFDVVMDAIGGESFGESYRSLRPGGRLVAFGAVREFDGGVRAEGDGPAKDFRLVTGVDASTVMIDSVSVIGLDLRVMWDHFDTMRPWLQPLEALLEAGIIRPVVSEVLPFARVADAHRILTERSNTGKVVLVP